MVDQGSPGKRHGERNHTRTRPRRLVYIVHSNAAALTPHPLLQRICGQYLGHGGRERTRFISLVWQQSWLLARTRYIALTTTTENTIWVFWGSTENAEQERSKYIYIQVSTRDAAGEIDFSPN